MKNRNALCYVALLLVFGVLSCGERYLVQPYGLAAIGQVVSEIPIDSVKTYNAFTAGVDGVNSYRIPSLVTASNGDLLLFCEARKTSWRDKSPTDIVLKTSSDNGVNWSTMRTLLSAGEDAFMDPVAVVNKKTGRIFLFSCLWPKNDVSMLNNSVWMMYSDDAGGSWSTAADLTNAVIPSGFYITGFGPGSGFQMSDQSNFPGRLIVPIRLSNGTINRNRVLYSDDQGSTWNLGQQMADGGEFQIAESPANTLIYNRRGNASRYKGTSVDGGVTWTGYQLDTALKSVEGGCQGSILGIDSVLLYTGPAGGNANSEVDNRANLTLYRSLDGGMTWGQKQLLFDKASGYSCISQLNNGDFAIVFESANTPGFIKSATRGYDWMRLDVLIVPKEILNKDYWFNAPVSTYFELDGSTYISIPDHGELNIENGQSKTFTFWYKPITGSAGRILNKRVGSTTGYEFVLNSTLTMAANIRSNSNMNLGTPNSIEQMELNQWNHIAVMYDQTGATKLGKIYLNGNLIAQSTSLAQSTNQSIEPLAELLFGTASSKTAFLKGAIDEIRIYDKALTLTQINTDMRTAKLVDYTDMIAVYDFENITNGQVINRVKNQHHGAVIGNVKTNQRIVQ
ncbi:sialidase family protein [Sphingobacterium paucimobilis]|uniref:sialidase family protein n=1 Tax=Sphingobacterium paucimobilis TaxID=1385985 RepID=UPI00040757BC|nr:sialidase family protein [Sphingobacterium paucimobilis]